MVRQVCVVIALPLPSWWVAGGCESSFSSITGSAPVQDSSICISLNPFFRKTVCRRSEGGRQRTEVRSSRHGKSAVCIFCESKGKRGRKSARWERSYDMISQKESAKRGIYIWEALLGLRRWLIESWRLPRIDFVGKRRSRSR